MTELHKRVLGKTGLAVAELGLGAMDTPGSPQGAETLNAALDLGIQLIDTARGYAGSERLIGEVLRGRERREVVLASKTFSRTIHGSQWDVDRSRTVLGVEAVELYQLHDVSTPAAWAEVMGEGGALEGLKIARQRGLIGHIGISTHNLDLAREAIMSDEFETVMLDYSAFYPDSAPLIELAHQRNVGVIVMRPLGGSGRTSVMRRRIEEGYSGLLTPANLLRYVLANPHVSVVIPGASYPSRVRANCETALALAPLAESTQRALEREAAELY